MIIKEQKFSSLEKAASALVDEMAKTLREAIRTRGRAVIAVSGGRTPKTVFKYLRQQKLEWNRVTLTLTDERWVPTNHQESNERLVNTSLLKYLPKETAFIPLYGGERSLEDDMISCEKRLKTLQLPFDVVYLGMGNDGHFASLFPGDKALNVLDSLSVAVAVRDFRFARISLTAPTILNAQKIFLLFSGEDKHYIYNKAKTPGSHHEIPIRLVLSQKDLPVVVYCAP